jgi:hypothetical protein
MADPKKPCALCASAVHLHLARKNPSANPNPSSNSNLKTDFAERCCVHFAVSAQVGV